MRSVKDLDVPRYRLTTNLLAGPPLMYPVPRHSRQVAQPTHPNSRHASIGHLRQSASSGVGIADEQRRRARGRLSWLPGDRHARWTGRQLIVAVCFGAKSVTKADDDRDRQRYRGDVEPARSGSSCDLGSEPRRDLIGDYGLPLVSRSRSGRAASDLWSAMVGRGHRGTALRRPRLPSGPPPRPA